MYRVFSALIAVCLAVEASAEAHQPSPRAGLQVGGAMRILAMRKQTLPVADYSPTGKPSRLDKSKAAIAQSLSHILNINDRSVVDPGPIVKQNSSMIYTVTRSLSLGVGYHFVDAEDLVGKVVVVGAMDADHQSHHVLLRARWQFE